MAGCNNQGLWVEEKNVEAVVEAVETEGVEAESGGGCGDWEGDWG